MADKALLMIGLRLATFLADELVNPIVDYGLVGFKVVTTLVSLAMALCANQNLEALVDFLGRHLPELRKAHVAV